MTQEGPWDTLAATWEEPSRALHLSTAVPAARGQGIKLALVPWCSSPFAPHPGSRSCGVLMRMGFVRSEKMPT